MTPLMGRTGKRRDRARELPMPAPVPPREVGGDVPPRIVAAEGDGRAGSRRPARPSPVERRPRVTCPVCGRNVALTPKTGLIVRHIDPRPVTSGRHCEGSKQWPDGRARTADLLKLAELVFAYPSRARELVARLPGTGHT